MTMTGVARNLPQDAHSRHDPLYFEKYYFTPATRASSGLHAAGREDGPSSAGTSGIPRARGSPRSRARRSSSTRRPSGGTLREDGARHAQHDAWQTIAALARHRKRRLCRRGEPPGHEGPKGGGIEFWGGSFICDPFGEVLAKASHDREETLVADCDLALQEVTDATGRSFETGASTRTARYSSVISNAEPRHASPGSSFTMSLPSRSAPVPNSVISPVAMT